MLKNVHVSCTLHVPSVDSNMLYQLRKAYTYRSYPTVHTTPEAVKRCNPGCHIPPSFLYIF